MNDLIDKIDCIYLIYNKQNNSWIDSYKFFIADNEAIAWDSQNNTYTAKNQIGNIILGKYKFWVLSIAYKLISFPDFPFDDVLTIAKNAKSSYYFDNKYYLEEQLIYLIKEHYDENTVLNKYLSIPNTPEVSSLDHDNYQIMISYYTDNEEKGSYKDEQLKVKEHDYSLSKIKPFNLNFQLKHQQEEDISNADYYQISSDRLKNKTINEIFRSKKKKYTNLVEDQGNKIIIQQDILFLKSSELKSPIISFHKLNKNKDFLSFDENTQNELRDYIQDNNRKEEYNLSNNNLNLNQIESKKSTD